MTIAVGLDKYGGGRSRYVSWGYFPYEDRYQQPTIDGRAAALIMKGGVFDAATGAHESIDQADTPIEQALIGTPIADPRAPVEVGHVCRSYDSCLVCTVHAYDAKTGAPLAKLRTA
jgi:hypothetical protein